MTTPYTRTGKQILQGTRHVADARDHETAAMIADALNGSPLVSFERAQAIGEELHDHWEKMAGQAPMRRDDMGWADIVQRVVRATRDLR